MGQFPGFLLPLFLAAVLGATAEGDAFFIALAGSMFVLNALGGATQHAVVPFVVALDRRAAPSFLGAVLVVTIAAAGGGALLLLGLSWGLAPAQLRAATSVFVLVLLPFVLTSAAATLWTGALNARGRYFVTAFSPMARWAVLFPLVWWFAPTAGFWALPIAYAAGEFVRSAVLFVVVRSEIGVAGLWRSPHRDVLPFLRTGAAQVFGSAAIALMPLVDRLMASRLGSGSASLLDYADRLWQAPVGLIVSGLLVVTLSEWSVLAERVGGVAQLRQITARRAMSLAGVTVVPVAVFVAFRHPIVGVLFGLAPFSDESLHLLADTLAAFVVGLPVYLAGLVYARAFLALRRSDWLLGVALVQLLLKITLNAVLMDAYGLPGIAMATAATYATGSFVLIWGLHRRIHRDLVAAA